MDQYNQHSFEKRLGGLCDVENARSITIKPTPSNNIYQLGKQMNVSFFASLSFFCLRATMNLKENASKTNANSHWQRDMTYYLSIIVNWIIFSSRWANKGNEWVADMQITKFYYYNTIHYFLMNWRIFHIFRSSNDTSKDKFVDSRALHIQRATEKNSNVIYSGNFH